MNFNTIVLSCSMVCVVGQAEIDSNFVNIATENPGIEVEMRYFSSWNFIGHPIDGYLANKCYLTKVAARALSEVQVELNKKGFSLLVLDCYRPQKAVAEFVKWTKEEKDLKMQSVFYAEEPKSKLVERGYIADNSGHSRGSTVDLTIVRNSSIGAKKNAADGLRFKENASDCRRQKDIEKTGQLNMGTTFDCFSRTAATDVKGLASKVNKNRHFLKGIMSNHGFENYPKEWWHYTLKDEPFKDTYFNFTIQ